jgi:hypothetical protein
MRLIGARIVTVFMSIEVVRDIVQRDEQPG